MDLNALAQDGDSWRILVKTVMNIRHKIQRSSWLDKDLLDSQKCSMELIMWLDQRQRYSYRNISQCHNIWC